MLRTIIISFMMFCAEAMTALAQDGRPGVGVDSRGGAVIDPTKNVLDLVQAAIQRQDDLRREAEKLQNAMRDADTRRLNELREAETRRINELATQKQAFDTEMARVLKSSVSETSLLLATQLKEVKQDLSDRMAKQEQFRFESGAAATGRNDVYGWIFGFLMMLIAAVGAGAAIKKRTPS